MKLDILKVVNLILAATHVVEKIKGASGPQRADAVIESTPAILSAVEDVIDRDVLNDARVVSAERNLLSAYVAFQNAVRDVKAAKVTSADPA